MCGITARDIGRLIADFELQYRGAQLKRTALASRFEDPVRLVWVVADTRRNRRVLEPHARIINAAFPCPSRRAWAALAAGDSLGGDALIWVRERDLFRR